MKQSANKNPIQRDTGQRRDGKVVVGYSELIDFVDWGVRALPSKIDTGARTSALHVENLRFVSDDVVKFDVVLSRKRQVMHRHVTAHVCRWARVRSSTGHFTRRCFVRTRIRMAGVLKEIELSLVSREKMVYRMLLGREALAGDFIVDVSKRRMHQPAGRGAARRDHK